MTSVVKNPAAFAPRERPVLFHAGFVVVATAWLLGGMGRHGEWIVAALAAPAFYFIFSEARARLRGGDRDGLRRLLRWSAPLLLLAALVLASALNPSHRPAFIFDAYLLRPVPHVAWLPSSVDPAGSLRLLACLGGLIATGLSLAFCVQSRGGLRILVLVLALNALLLAVFGTVQRQTGAIGPYFGFVPAANPTWFSTFFYHNHWGAFASLSCAATLGLLFHSLRHVPDRGWQYGPGPLLTLGALLIAATAPLTSSRSATVLMLVLSVTATVVYLRSLLRSTRRHRRRVPVLGALTLVAVIVALGFIVATQSRDVLATRLTQTLTQLSATAPAGYSRADLYSDTWRMAADAPVFGWGLESYGLVFPRYSTVRPDINGVRGTFINAHSDWLQSLAELGSVGTLLLLAAAALPLVETLRHSRHHLGPLSSWLLGGCALLAAYAWFEFPFACPAVVAAWWVLFFTALRLAQLTPSEVGPHPRAPHSPISSGS